jgi:hypothetical protein
MFVLVKICSKGDKMMATALRGLHFSFGEMSAADQRKVAHALSAARSEAHKDGASPGVGKA